MKIKLIVEKGNRYCEIPFTRKELDDLMDMAWYLIDEPDMKINGIDVGKLAFKLTRIVNDVIDDGATTEVIAKKVKGKTKIKFVKSKERWYIYKKPKWKVKKK